MGVDAPTLTPHPLEKPNKNQKKTRKQNTLQQGYVSGITLEESISPQAGFGFEMVGTLLLLTVVFNVAVWTSEPLSTDLSGSTIAALAPVPIGFAVLVVHLVLGPYTGCGINPVGETDPPSTPLDVALEIVLAVCPVLYWQCALSRLHSVRAGNGASHQGSREAALSIADPPRPATPPPHVHTYRGRTCTVDDVDDRRV